MVNVACTNCGRHLRIPDIALGKKGRCPHCNKVCLLRGVIPVSNHVSIDTTSALHASDSAKNPATSEPVSIPRGTPVSASVDQWYLHSHDGKQYGPVTKSELNGWVAQGLLTSECQLWRDGWSAWRPATKIYPELSQSSISPRPPSIPAVNTSRLATHATKSHVDERVSTPQMAWLLAAVLIVPAFTLGLGPRLTMAPLAFVFAAASVVGGWKLFEAYCRPISTQYGKPFFPHAAGSFAFTATAGIVLLLLFQELANYAAASRSSPGGIVGILFAICKVVGIAYGEIQDTASITTFFAYLFSVGPCEEMCKLLPVIFLVRTIKPGSLTVRDVLFIGAASGLGFGVAEGIDYSYRYYGPEAANLGRYLFRFTVCVGMHALWTLLSALILFRVRHLARASPRGGQYSILLVIGFVFLVTLPSAAIHALYDTLAGMGSLTAFAIVCVVLNGGAVFLISQWTLPADNAALSPRSRREVKAVVGERPTQSIAAIPGFPPKEGESPGLATLDDVSANYDRRLTSGSSNPSMTIVARKRARQRQQKMVLLGASIAGAVVLIIVLAATLSQSFTESTGADERQLVGRWQAPITVNGRPFIAEMVLANDRSIATYATSASGELIPQVWLGRWKVESGTLVFSHEVLQYGEITQPVEQASLHQYRIVSVTETTLVVVGEIDARQMRYSRASQ